MTPEDHQALESAFIEGFRHAGDKLGFLRLARIPLELTREDRPGLKLMQVLIEEIHEVGRASPGFASRELVYHPLPGRLATAKARLSFRYVSTGDVCELSLADLLHMSADAPDHHHGHPGIGVGDGGKRPRTPSPPE